MASITTQRGGNRCIQFVDESSARKTIRLGKCDRKAAESICRHVEALLAAKLTGQPIPRETAVWLAGVGAKCGTASPPSDWWKPRNGCCSASFSSSTSCPART